MKKRNIVIILLLILAVILLVWSQKKEVNTAKLKNNILNKINFNDINEIAIKNYVSKKVVLKKNEKGEWIEENSKRKCNKYKIGYMFNLLKDTDFNNVISDKKENYANFDVDNKSSIKVTIKTQNGNIHLWIGKFTPDGNGCYVRLDDGKVYLITKNLTYEFDKKKKYFYLEQDNVTKKMENK